jgi:hypothetical protein
LGAIATGAAGKDEQAGGVAVSSTVTDEITRVVAEIDEIDPHPPGCSRRCGCKKKGTLEVQAIKARL